MIKPSRVRDYARSSPEAAEPLLAWLRVALGARWQSLAEVPRTYPRADPIRVASGRTVTCFNIRGNKYRLIVAINYKWQMVYVLRFLPHAPYARSSWKESL